jgi:hypothetical protein
MFDGCWPGSRLATFFCITCVSHRSCGISAGMVPHFYMIRILVVLSALMALLTSWPLAAFAFLKEFISVLVPAMR